MKRFNSLKGEDKWITITIQKTTIHYGKQFHNANWNKIDKLHSVNNRKDKLIAYCIGETKKWSLANKKYSSAKKKINKIERILNF